MKLKKTLAFLMAGALALSCCACAKNTGFTYAAAESQTISGETLRERVAARAEAIANVDWTLENRVSSTTITGDRLTAFREAGILPTTYFNYTRMGFPLKGIMVESNGATYEQFLGTVEMEWAVVPGIGHVTTEKSDMIGMDMNTFLTDISALVLKNPLTGVKAALTSEDLTALYSGADFSAASSMAAISSADDVKAAYAKLEKGDLLLSWNDDAKVTLAQDETDAALATLDPKIHAMVVTNVDHAAGTVTVTYATYAKFMWYFQCDTCGVIETEGPTGAVCPIHTDSGTAKTHAATDASTTCTGTWKPMYGTTWATETVTYDQLLGEGELNVPYGSTGYLPYTFKAYEAGQATAAITMETEATAKTLAEGLSATITSDYPITAIKAVVTPKSGEAKEFFQFPDLDTKSVVFENKMLNATIMDGQYSLKIFVRSGPLSEQELAAGEYREIASIEVG